MRAQVVQHQHLGGKDRLQQFQLRGLHLRIVAVLDALEQLAIVAEEAANAALHHQPAQHTHRQVRFSHADGAGKEQSLARCVHRIGLDKFPGGHVRAAQRGICAVKGGREAVQGVMPVALGDVGRGQAALLAFHLLALAGARDPFTLVVDHPHQPHSIADRACTHLHSSLAQRPPVRSGALRVPYCGKARWQKRFARARRDCLQS